MSSEGNSRVPGESGL
jgi:hypothetical protein